MSRTIAIVLVVILGLYCFPTIVGIVAGALGMLVGLAASVFGAGLGMAFTLLPYLILGYLIWWLIRDHRRQH